MGQVDSGTLGSSTVLRIFRREIVEIDQAEKN